MRKKDNHDVRHCLILSSVSTLLSFLSHITHHCDQCQLFSWQHTHLLRNPNLFCQNPAGACSQFSFYPSPVSYWAKWQQNWYKFSNKLLEMVGRQELLFWNWAFLKDRSILLSCKSHSFSADGNFEVTLATKATLFHTGAVEVKTLTLLFRIWHLRWRH